MDKEREIEKANEIVRDILETCESARNSDELLIALVVQRINPDALDMKFQDLLLNYNHLDLPKFETIRRARQKCQADIPELKGNRKVQSLRAINEEVFREYARG